MHARVCQLQADLDRLDSSDLVPRRGLISNRERRGGGLSLREFANIHSRWAVDLTRPLVNELPREGQG